MWQIIFTNIISQHVKNYTKFKKQKHEMPLQYITIHRLVKNLKNWFWKDKLVMTDGTYGSDVNCSKIVKHL